MTHETFLLAAQEHRPRAPGVRWLASKVALRRAVRGKRGAANWVADVVSLSWLPAFTSTKKDSLLLLERPRPTQVSILRARFKHVWERGPGMACLPRAELMEALGSARRDALFVGGGVDATEKVVMLLRANLEVVIAGFDLFPPSGVAKPDFSRFRVIDYGTAVSFGD